MSSWHTSQLKYALGLTSIMSFYGMVSIAVWFLGDSLGYAMAYRVVIIAFVLLTLPFALVGSYLVSRRSKKAAIKAEEEDKESNESVDDVKQKEPVKSVNSNEDVSKGAEEVIEFLKNSNLGANGSSAVYSLPWYMIAGTPKSGKSSLVLGSGLNFQTLPSQRQSEQNHIRPTRQIDWRVTSDAVFVDTAGRFQTDGINEEEWASVLETIKKYRTNRPLDGFILAVNAERILHSDDREIEEMAKTIRSRLDETTKRLKTKFPVYLVFTHADAIEGFRDSFSTSKKEGENLVWGATIPLEKSENAQSLFDSEYEILQDSVMKRRLIRLSAPFSPTRQLRIFNFPLHFGSARRKLGTFVTTLFRPNPFSESPFLRGFYFTAVPINRDNRRGKPAANTPKTIGSTYFTKKFFRDVVLRDKDLVKTFQEQKQKPPILGWLLTILGAILTLAFLAMVGVSLYNNKIMLEEAAAKGDALLTIVKSDAGKDPLSKSSDEARREIEATEDLRKVLVKLDEYERNGAPLSMRFGLYSGDRLYRERLLNIYYNAIEQRFKIPTFKRVEKELQQFSTEQTSATAGNLTDEQEQALDKKYKLLKTYLMWSGGSYKTKTGEEIFYKTYAEPTTFTQELEDYWFTESKLPAEYEETAEAQLDFYFKQIDRESEYDNDKSGFPRIPLDNNLVKATRNKLEAFPNYLRYLSRVTTDVTKEVGSTTVETVLAGRSQGVLQGSHAVPGAYTIEGYRGYMKEAIANANEKLSEDDWVMGEKAGGSATQTTELSKLQEKYFNEYTDHWREFIRKTTVIQYDSKENMIKALNAFSDEESPMKLLLEEVERNTNLSGEPEALGWIDWIKSFWTTQQDNKTGGDTAVEKAFSPLFKFVGGKEESDKSSPISQYGSSLKTLNNKLNGISENQIETLTKDLAEEKGSFTASLKAVETSVSSKTEAFKATSAGQEIAILLQEPVTQVRAFFGAGVKEQITKIWTNQILSKAKEIEKGYPFDNNGEADLSKITAYLNPINGTLSKFYSDNLDRYFEEKDGKFVVKEGSDVQFSSEFVSYLNNAFALRTALFNKQASPNFQYEFKLLPVKDSIIEIMIDGQKVTSEGTASTTLKFPASTGVDSGVSVNFTSTGANSTSGDTLPPASSANNSDSSVNTPQTNNFLQDSTNAQLKFPGNWGLFKFFEAGNPTKQPGGEYLLTHTVSGKVIKSSIKPLGGVDLFDRDIFRRVKTPDKIQQ
ncbi:MAG: type VI secretion system membrane subunit TssM [Aridibacter sp.]